MQPFSQGWLQEEEAVQSRTIQAFTQGEGALLYLPLCLVWTSLSFFRVKSYLKWIFAHAIKPKKYITARQGSIVVGKLIQ